MLAAAAVALLGTDTAVAVSRTAGSTGPGTPAATRLQPAGTTPAQPGVVPSFATTQPADPANALTPSDTAKTLLARANQDALSQGSVHTVARNVSKKYGTSIFDNYDTTTGGRQHISIYGGDVRVRVVGPTTYFTGDKRGLIRFFGFTADEVAVLHHQWLPLTAGQAGYKATTAGITLRSVLNEDRIVGRLHLLAERTRNGVRVIGVRGKAGGTLAGKHATATQWITIGEHPLPVEFDVTSRDTRSVQTFSEWGRPVHVAPPANVFGAKTLEG